MVVDTKVVFEWCDLDYHQAWVESGEISPDEMKDILAEPGQAAGKGYYVSLSPTDSMSYGPALTMFHPKGGSIVALEYLPEYSAAVGSDTAFVQRLSDAGIQAMRFNGYQETWLAVINSKVLQRANPMSKTVFQQIKADPFGMSNMYSMRTNVPSHLMAGAGMTPLQMKVLSPTELTLEDLKEAKAASLPMNYVGEGLKILAKRFDLPAIKAVMGFLHGGYNFPDSYSLPNLLQNIQKPVGTPYREIMTYFDLASVARGVTSAKLVPGFTKAIADYKARIAQTDFSQAGTFAGALQAAQKVLGGAIPQYRDQGVTVKTPALKGNSYAYALYLLNQRNVADGTIDFDHTDLDIIRIYRVNLSAEFQQDLEAFYAVTPVDLKSDAARALLKRGLQEMAERIWDPATSQLKMDTNLTYSGGQYHGEIYNYDGNYKVQALMMLRPFQGPNYRLMKFLTEAYTRRSGFSMPPQIDSVVIPDLSPITISNLEMASAGMLLKNWVALATDDADFAMRSREAMKAYFEMFPELKPIYPKLQF